MVRLGILVRALDYTILMHNNGSLTGPQSALQWEKYLATTFVVMVKRLIENNCNASKRLIGHLVQPLDVYLFSNV